MELADLRRDFGKYTFNPAQTPENPNELFDSWLQEAKELNIDEFNAMVLSTVNTNQQPSSRIVLLKDIEMGALVFYTHYESRKGKDLNHNPKACLLFFWKELERQVRIEGIIEKIPYFQSNAYFKSRPIESQISAMASPQSQAINGIESVARKKEEISKSELPLECPTYWGGYKLTPNYYEFWQGGQHRLHRRLSYNFDNNRWGKQELAP